MFNVKSKIWAGLGDYPDAQWLSWDQLLDSAEISSCLTPLSVLLPFTLSPFSSLPSPPSLNLIFSNSLSLYVFDQLSIYA